MVRYLLKINREVYRRVRLISEVSLSLPEILIEWYAEHDGPITSIEIVRE